MRSKYADLAQSTLEMAVGQGADEAEVFLLDDEYLKIEVAKSKVENLQLAKERGLGLRVLRGKKLGFAYSSDLSPEALSRVVEKSIHNAGFGEVDQNWILPRPAATYPTPKIDDQTTFTVALEDKISLAQRIEEAARGVDSRITITERAAYFDSHYAVHIFNTAGIAAAYQGSYCGAYASMVAQEKGARQTGFHQQIALSFADLDPENIGRKAGEKTIRLLGAKSIPSGRLPIILEPYTAAQLIGVLQPVFSGEAALKEKSFWHDKLGEQVTNPLLTFIDDGTMEGRLGSSPFDGEGVPTSRTVLLKDGILQGFLHNSYTARKTGAQLTGNGVRGSYKGTPEVGTTNFYLQQGTTPETELYRDTTKGLLVTGLMGLHTANPISGDFSLGATGLLIENGQLTKPVKGIVIAGNMQDLLQNIEAVGNDLTFFGGRGSPSLRISAVSISGS